MPHSVLDGQRSALRAGRNRQGSELRFVSLAKFALASQYKSSGQDAKAIDLYKQLIAHPSRTVGKAEAQLELASLYAAKQPAEAKKMYEEISKENPASAAAQR